MRDRIKPKLPIITLPLLGLLTLTIYWPGLHGGFLFDDFGNLPALGKFGPINNWATFWRYITSGIADPTGRPLTLLTFLLDANNWPADPWPFKRTNLILHLCNGGLLYLLLTRIGQQLRYDIHRARSAALFGSSMWLLHPLLVSTTLYIVQREAMLPATCLMSGLLLWLHGRERLVTGKIGSGLSWSAIGLGGFTVLGTLAKANGILLPLYALLIELVILAPRQPMPAGGVQRAYRLMLLPFVVFPTIALFGYLVWIGLHGIIAGGTPGVRTWTYAQRLWTEPRVLMDYLELLWLPQPFSSGLFNDQYTASTAWLHPITTLPALLAVLTLVGGAWWQRQRHPALALAVLFYFAGQLLESTSIPLELYFEHRNYVPALLMFWPLGLWLTDGRNLQVPKHVLLLALPLVLAGMTYLRANLWGNVQAQAMVWARINPDSPRAQANAAQVEIDSGHPQDAVRRLEGLLIAQPDQAQLAFNMIDARCKMGGITARDIATALNAMRKTPNTGSLVAQWGERTLPIAVSGRCLGLTPAVLLQMIDAGQKNPKLAEAGPQQDLIYLRGLVALAAHQPAAGLAEFTRALDLQVRPDMALKAAATLGAAGYPAQGLRLLDHYQRVRNAAMPPSIGMPMLHAWVLARQNYWPHEFTHLRDQLNLDVKAGNADTARSRPDASTAH